jgi:hypothetical protein
MSGTTPAVHLVYPHLPRVSAPDSIGYQLGQRLEQHYSVKYYNFDEIRVIKPAPGDVLLGHPHPSPWTCFRRSLAQPGWRRRLSLAPYHHGDDVQVAFEDAIISGCDLHLAITGNFWFSSIETSAFAHWRPKMIHVDMAVDRRDFPALNRQFNPPGQRRFVYIGHSGWTKNTDYLSTIARAMPETPIDWIGRPLRAVPNVQSLGLKDFSTAEGRQVIAQYDFMITVGRADANPTTVLEAMAWGLIPVCTPQSGYVDRPGIVNVPLDNVPGAVNILRRLQNAPDSDLRAMQMANWQALDTHFNWDRFAGQVIDAIESEARPPLGPEMHRHRWYLRWMACISPYAPWRPMNLARLLVHAWRYRRSNSRSS